jgi:ribosome-binding ATPase YchF (GTP1/OBG family)
VIELYRTVLEDGRSLHGIALNPEDTKRLLGFSFRSVKPLRIVLNLGESDVFDPDRAIDPAGLTDILPGVATEAVPVCAKIELEFAELVADDHSSPTLASTA